MKELERFLHDKAGRTPTLEKAALAHVQFETIHPFLDGNGRLGRLLITLLLVSEGVLQDPLLYLSLYFKTHRRTYYDLLQRVRTDGDWEAWISFFVRGVRETSEQAVASARELAELFRKDREKLQNLKGVAGSALRVHEALQRHPILPIGTIANRTKLSVPTVTSVMNRLQEAGIVRELTGKRRNRVFGYDRYVQILNEGTVPASK